MKVTLITGATGGLGKAFCSLYASDGENLVLCATNQDKLDALKSELEEKFPSIVIDTIIADLSNQEQIFQVCQQVHERGYVVTRLINNAGFGDRCDFDQMDVDTQIKMITVNCTAPTVLTRAFIDDMKNNGGGHVINVASIASFVPGPYMCTYHSTKSYLLNFSEAIAVELKKFNIKVLALCPGPFTSGFVARAGNDYTFEKIKPISAEKVALIGYNASKKGKAVQVVGFANKLTVFAPRFVSRSFVAKTSAKTLKKGV